MAPIDEKMTQPRVCTDPPLADIDDLHLNQLGALTQSSAQEAICQSEPEVQLAENIPEDQLSSVNMHWLTLHFDDPQLEHLYRHRALRPIFTRLSSLTMGLMLQISCSVFATQNYNDSHQAPWVFHLIGIPVVIVALGSFLLEREQLDLFRRYYAMFCYFALFLGCAWDVWSAFCPPEYCDEDTVYREDVGVGILSPTNRFLTLVFPPWFMIFFNIRWQWASVMVMSCFLLEFVAALQIEVLSDDRQNQGVIYMTNYIMCFGACLATMYYSEYGLRHVFYLDRHNLELIARTAKAEQESLQQKQQTVDMRAELAMDTVKDLGIPLAAVHSGCLCLKELCKADERASGILAVMLATNTVSLNFLDGLTLSARMFSEDINLKGIAPHYAPTAVRKLVYESISIIKLGGRLLPGVQLKYEFDTSIGPELIMSDPAWLRKIVLVLISNACKSTTEGVIELAVDLCEANTMMRFTLSDTGAGLQEDDLSNVFDPVRSGAASAVRGLYLAQQQSHSMGGDIGVHANQKAGRGLVVWFQVPYSPIPDTEEKESASLDLALLDSYVGQSASGASKKQPVPPSELPELLLVEDNPAILMFEALWLRSVGYNVHTACDSASAVAQLQRHCYAVVLLDINIPGGSGLSVIRQFRQWENIHRVGKPRQVVCLLSAYVNSFDLDPEELKQLEVLRVFEKPLDLDQLSGIVQQSPGMSLMSAGLLGLPTGLLLRIARDMGLAGHNFSSVGYSANMIASVCARFSWLVELMQHENQLEQRKRHYVRDAEVPPSFVSEKMDVGAPPESQLPVPSSQNQPTRRPRQRRQTTRKAISEEELAQLGL